MYSSLMPSKATTVRSFTPCPLRRRYATTYEPSRSKAALDAPAQNPAPAPGAGTGTTGRLEPGSGNDLSCTNFEDGASGRCSRATN